MNKLIALLLLGVFPASVFAGENYKKIDDFIAQTYQKSDDQNAPWHKKGRLTRRSSLITRCAITKW